jgi:AcrR family transcriptional regulator
MNSEHADTMPRLTARGRATRERILEATADLILQQGVVSTGINDVRAATGVSGSQMTHYFMDKRHLVKDVIAWQAQSALNEHQAPELGKLDSLAALRLWADRHIEGQRRRQCQGGCSFGALAGQLVESDLEMRNDLASGFGQWLELFRHGLALMRDRGDLAPNADPDSLAQAMLAAMQGGMLLSQTLRDIAPLRASLEAALTCVGIHATDADLAAKTLRLPLPGATMVPDAAVLRVSSGRGGHPGRVSDRGPRPDRPVRADAPERSHRRQRRPRWPREPATRAKGGKCVLCNVRSQSA